MVVIVARQADIFARLQVTDQDSDQVAMVDLAADFREREPVQLSIGRMRVSSLWEWRVAWINRVNNDTFDPCQGVLRWPTSARWPATSGGC
jgi:hypothetical protein